MITGDRTLAGRYRVGECIGRGGMADVYAGTDERLGRTVAIKLLNKQLASDPSFRERFRKEASSAARMSHPTIVRVYDAGQDTFETRSGDSVELPYIVMEYVDGRMLRDIIAEGSLGIDESLRIFRGILTALEYSHRAGVVHRDIKPGNVMITKTGQVKVMDFGIARAVSDNHATVAQTTAILGTASYFSPEQARGEVVDARSDLYSAGVVLFEMLTGRVPFRGDTAVAVAYQHVSEKPVAPSSINPEVSPELDAVVAHALVKDPKQRYQSAAQFRADVEAAAEGRMPQTSAGNDVATTGEHEPVLAGASVATTGSTERTIERLADSGPGVEVAQRPPIKWIWAGVGGLLVVLLIVFLFMWGLLSQRGIDTNNELPDVAGQTYDEASKTLHDLGYEVSRVDEESASVGFDHVITTRPAAGVRVDRNTVIRLVVSTGPAASALPSFAGLDPAVVKQRLETANFVVGQTLDKNDPTIPAGKVMGTNPAAGTPVKQGITVDILVSTGKVTVPQVKGLPMEQALSQLRAPAVGLKVEQVPLYDCYVTNDRAVVNQSIAPGDAPQGSTIQLTYCGAERPAPSPTPTPTPVPTPAPTAPAPPKPTP